MPFEALRAITAEAPSQCFEENRKGTLEAGKLADLVIFFADLMAVESMKIDDVKVLETIKEGKSIYTRPAGEAALSSPAMFGLTLHDGYDHAIPGVQPVHGDGCFNHGLGVLIHALDSARQSASDAGNP